MLKEFIPIIAVIVGGLIGFGSSYVTASVERTRSREDERDKRHRNRLEEVYELLLDIRKDYQEILGQCINKIHFSTQMIPPSHADRPPIIRLGMLIHLYLHDLEENFAVLSKAIETFGENYTETITGDFSVLDRSEKQKKAGALVKKFEKIDRQLDLMQKAVAKLAEA